jgi:DNA ligase 1
MLAKPTKAIGEVLDRFEDKRFTCEYKYDGERAQVHKLVDGTVGVFSRNSEDMSKKYPDLVEQLPHVRLRSLHGGTSFSRSDIVHQREHKIVRVGRGSCGHRQNDGEVDAVPGAEQTQAEGCKGGRYPNTRMSLRVRYPLPQWGSECSRYLLLQSRTFLLINRTQSLLQRNLSERRELLRQHFEPVDFEFQFAKSSESEKTEDIQTFLDESVKDGCEGLMVKMLESEASYYEPSRRSVNWLKVSVLHHSLLENLTFLGDS